MSEDALFRVIESVLKEREETGSYSIRDKIHDVMSAVDRQQPGTTMSVGEISKILIRVKAKVSRMAISRGMRELQDEGRVVFVDKEMRPGNAREQPVPVYKVADDA